MLNEKVASILYEIADLLELKGGEPFKPRAYRNAAHAIEETREDIEDVYKRGKLREVPGVGDAIAKKVAEIIDTGELGYLTELRNEFPSGLIQLMAVPEIGPKTTMLLYRQLNITSLQELKQAVEQHRIRRLKGFGQKTEENILNGIRLVESSKGRMLLSNAYPAGKMMTDFLLAQGVEHVSLAGSLRRMKETIGDIDVLAGSDEPARVMYQFVHGPDVKEIIGQGQTKASVRLKDDVQVDLLVVPDKSFGAALQYFTGSKEHNIKLRSMAIDMGYKLNEFGLFRKDTDEMVAGHTEEEIYRVLGVDIMPPEMREDRGEIEAGVAHNIPQIVELSDIKGDFHVHTEMSDGNTSMEAMAEAARQKGYQYIAVTDHSESLTIAGGLSVERLRKNIEEARRISEKMAPFRVLIGTEVEIEENGKLEYPNEELKELDLVVGSVHSRFKMSEMEMTNRIISAMSNENLTILAHPTGRRIGQREQYQVNIDLVMEAAKEKGVLLEVNAFPERLDLNDVNCRKAREKGLDLVISTDSHSIKHLDYMVYGVAMARRGWLGPEQIINTRPLAELEKYLGI
ncbi:MAG TPA: DNA polymerase/3'-5' exonuclease PolX [Methanomassiliicoccales archaeon]|jgi:DNA polymerase (family 10)